LAINVIFKSLRKCETEGFRYLWIEIFATVVQKNSSKDSNLSYLDYMGNRTINSLIIVNFCKDQGVKISTVAAAVADVFSTKLQQKIEAKKKKIQTLRLSQRDSLF
jgi:hypothetical protein